MSGEGEVQRGSAERGERRRIVYCLIPRDLAPKLHAPLRAHFSDDPGVEAIVERRGAERRSGNERRQGEGPAPAAGERRVVHSSAGRRIGERRAAQVPVEPPELPRRARRHLERLAFVERLEPSSEETEDADTARVVTRFQGGDGEAFGTLYTRYFDRVYSYLLVVLANRDEAEEATQTVFTNALAALQEFEYRGQPFRAWLFTIARNCAVDQLRLQGRIEVTDPQELARRREAELPPDEDLPILDWISDRDVALFVERLPLPQRQVLILSYGIELPDRTIAAVLGRSREDVRKLRSRALAFLRERLDAIGRRPDRHDRIRMRRVPKEAPVLRSRRWALYL